MFWQLLNKLAVLIIDSCLYEYVKVYDMLYEL